MPEENISLVPPLTPEQLKANEEFQLKTKFRFTMEPTSRRDYAIAAAGSLVDILIVLQDQFEREKNDTKKQNLAVKAEQYRGEIAEWLKNAGMFDASAEFCPDAQKPLYLAYAEAESRDDSDWCDHPRWRIENNKKQPNYYREFDYFSPKRGRITSMLKCSDCEMRNAADTPDDLLKLDEIRQAAVEKHKNSKN